MRIFLTGVACQTDSTQGTGNHASALGTEIGLKKPHYAQIQKETRLWVGRERRLGEADLLCLILQSSGVAQNGKHR